jgi:hypothetical protein
MQLVKLLISLMLAADVAAGLALVYAATAPQPFHQRVVIHATLLPAHSTQRVQPSRPRCGVTVVIPAGPVSKRGVTRTLGCR